MLSTAISSSTITTRFRARPRAGGFMAGGAGAAAIAVRQAWVSGPGRR